MNVIIVSVGKPKAEYYETAVQQYEKRLGRWVKLSWQFIPTSDLAKESVQILRRIPTQSLSVLLDERGDGWTTPQLAAFIEAAQNQSFKDLVFIIGGAHGVSQAVRQAVNQVWSLSPLVFPHELVRVLLVEQLYRAYDLNHGGQYHHV